MFRLAMLIDTLCIFNLYLEGTRSYEVGLKVWMKLKPPSRIIHVFAASQAPVTGGVSAGVKALRHQSSMLSDLGKFLSKFCPTALVKS